MINLVTTILYGTAALLISSPLNVLLALIFLLFAFKIIYLIIS